MSQGLITKFMFNKKNIYIYEVIIKKFFSDGLSIELNAQVI